MRLKRLTIENFQSHACTEIDFGEGLNVIVGESDRGKSAVVRALRWLFYNEPRGTDFIRVGEKKCRVECVLEDGTVLTRERTPSKNRYTIVPPGQEPVVFEGFGSDVPAEVAAVHGAVRVQLDDDLNVSLNLAGQLEGPFLLSAPGSLKAKAIGRIHNVHVIDAAVRDTGHDIAALQREDKRLEKEIQELDSRLKEFEDLSEIQERLQKGARLMERLERVQELRERLIQVRDRLGNIRREKIRQEENLQKTACLDAVARTLELLEEKGHRLRKINDLHRSYEENASSRKRVVKVMEASYRVGEGEKYLEELREKVERRNSLKMLFEKLGRSVKERLRYEEVVSSTASLSQAGQEVKELHEMLERLRKLQDLSVRLAAVRQAGERNKKIIEKTESLPKWMESLKRCDEYSERKRVLAELAGRMEDTRRRIASGKKYLEERKKDQREGLRRYEKLLRELGRCPVCFGKVDAKVIDRIISNLGGD